MAQKLPEAEDQPPEPQSELLELVRVWMVLRFRRRLRLGLELEQLRLGFGRLVLRFR